MLPDVDVLIDDEWLYYSNKWVKSNYDKKYYDLMVIAEKKGDKIRKQLKKLFIGDKSNAKNVLLSRM